MLTDYISKRKLLILLLDLLVLFLSFLIASVLILGKDRGNQYFINNNPGFLFAIGISLAVFYLTDMYYILKDFKQIKELIKIAAGTFTAFFTVLIFSKAFFFLSFNYRILISMFIFVYLGVILNRIILNLFIDRDLFVKKALIIGINEASIEIVRLIKDTPYAGITNIGLLRLGAFDVNIVKDIGLPVLGGGGDLKSIVKSYSINLLIISSFSKIDTKLIEAILSLRQQGVHIIGMPTLYERIQQRVPIQFIDDHWLLDSCLSQNKFQVIKIKGVFDIIASLIALILFLPFLLIIAIIVKLDSKGPVFYSQERLGRDGKPFMIKKIRTMHIDIKKTGQVFTGNTNRRMTRVGYFLRKYRIDEIPQFINVLKGEMSIIGPRPEWRDFIREMQKDIPFYRLRLITKPGITGWAQTNYKHSISLKEYLIKFEYDLYYLKNMSPLLDFTIFFKTIWSVLSGKGV